MQTAIEAPQGQEVRHGLTAAAYTSPAQGAGGPQRWELGFSFVPETCSKPESWIIPCIGTASGGPGDPITDNRGPTVTAGLQAWTPYVVRAAFKCDAQQAADTDFEARARLTFELGESKLMETELWRGDAAGLVRATGDPAFTAPNLSLVSNLPDSPNFQNLTTGGATTPALGIRALIQAAATSPGGSMAMLHATPATAMGWMQSGALEQERNGTRLRTKVGGHPVVVGSGYTGTGPGDVPDADPSIHWAYVTSPVYLLRAPDMEVLWDMDRAANDQQVIVQRTACAYWDGCLHAGVPIDTMATVV